MGLCMFVPTISSEFTRPPPKEPTFLLFVSFVFISYVIIIVCLICFVGIYISVFFIASVLTILVHILFCSFSPFFGRFICIMYAFAYSYFLHKYFTHVLSH